MRWHRLSKAERRKRYWGWHERFIWFPTQCSNEFCSVRVWGEGMLSRRDSVYGEVYWLRACCQDCQGSIDAQRN